MLELLKALFWVIVAGLMRFLGVTRKRIGHPDPVMEEMRKRGYDPKKIEKIIPSDTQQQIAVKLNAIVEGIIQTDEQLGENPFSEGEVMLLMTATTMAAGLMDSPDVQMRPTFHFLGAVEDSVLKITFSALETGGKRVEVKNMIGADTIGLRGRPNTNRFVTELARMIEEQDLLVESEVSNGNQESGSGQD